MKVTNRAILRNLKVRLAKPKSEWAKDLPSVLWAYHTTNRTPIRKVTLSLPGDLVLRKVTLSTKELNAGKLGPTWEGPYKVVKVSRPGTY